MKTKSCLFLVCTPIWLLLLIQREFVIAVYSTSSNANVLDRNLNVASCLGRGTTSVADRTATALNPRSPTYILLTFCPRLIYIFGEAIVDYRKGEVFLVSIKVLGYMILNTIRLDLATPGLYLNVHECRKIMRMPSPEKLPGAPTVDLNQLLKVLLFTEAPAPICSVITCSVPIASPSSLINTVVARLDLSQIVYENEINTAGNCDGSCNNTCNCMDIINTMREPTYAQLVSVPCLAETIQRPGFEVIKAAVQIIVEIANGKSGDPFCDVVNLILGIFSTIPRPNTNQVSLVLFQDGGIWIQVKAYLQSSCTDAFLLPFLQSFY